MKGLNLRRINPQAHAGAQAVRRWLSAGVQAGSGAPEPAQYLRFRASGECGDWWGLIDARGWLHRSLPTLQSLLAVECSLIHIVELFRAVPRPLPMDVDDLHYRNIGDAEAVPRAQLPTQALPWLDSACGRVWVTQLPPAPAAGRPLASESWLDDLPLHLDLMLGWSHLRQVVRLNEGDVLRIIHRSQRGCVGNHCLGDFTFTELGIHMQSTVEDTHSAPAPEVDLGAVPVRLEFVLATHAIDLATLTQIIDGQLIALADEAARHIEVRANGKAVARGELVQLGEQLAVELLEVYRAARDE
ncbi:FliM/FliN family flagellar motor switch protein [Pseudomonas sp. KK4]|uniref:FliM/FliN family flagellar motor switch protein n=1 Tax=Pseudomonas sp. KK4 TaxID=1855729 RepID=UPI00097CB485|nr:FliM/FliN family flagellar motor switch protein [Pseudomonas sp. KK4]